MSPFKSKAQMKAAFAGGLGAEMKAKARAWAHETPDVAALPERVAKKRAKPKSNKRRGRLMKKAAKKEKR